MLDRRRSQSAPPSRRMAIRGALLAGPATLGAALAGCSAEVNVGNRDQASGAKIAKVITEQYESRTKVKLPRLTCQEAEANVGAPIACTGRNARDIELELAGEVTKVDDDGLDYRWRVSKALAPGTFYANGARRVLERDGAPVADLRCPTKVEVRVDNEVQCELRTTDGQRRAVMLLLTDTDGAFRIKIAGANSGEQS